MADQSSREALKPRPIAAIRIPRIPVTVPALARVLLGAPAFAAAESPEAPRARPVATGGTISNRTGGRLTAEERVKSMPDLERYARPEFEQHQQLLADPRPVAAALAPHQRRPQLALTVTKDPAEIQRMFTEY